VLWRSAALMLSWLIRASSPRAPSGHRSGQTAAPVVSTAVDLQTVKVVGEMLKALAEARSRVIN
jgi:hypothetical protein